MTALTLDRSMTLKTMAAEGVKTERQFENASTYKRTMKAMAKHLKLPGASPMRMWEYVHPLSQTGIATQGVVVGWNLSSSVAANDLGAVFASLGGSVGGQGNTKVSKKTDGKKADEKKKAGGAEGEGASSIK